MDVIKGIENFQYYHSMTDGSREEWQAWRVQVCKEWMLDKAILQKGAEEDGMCEGEPDNSGDDSILHVSA